MAFQASDKYRKKIDERDKYANYEDSDYIKSQIAKKAELDAQGAPVYTNNYADLIKDTQGKITNRRPFAYDAANDALYQQYKDIYMQQGKLAMQDTIGRASALTGGYGNSYAATVGNQAYQGYLSKLNEAVPELYKMAYARYADEGNNLKDLYNLYKTEEAGEYGRYRDELADYGNVLDRLTNDINNTRAWDYGVLKDSYNRADKEANTIYGNEFNAYQQGVSEDQWAKTFAENKRVNDEQIKTQKAARSSSSSSSRSGGGGRPKSYKKDDFDAVEEYIKNNIKYDGNERQLYEYLAMQVSDGFISPEAMDYLFDHYRIENRRTPGRLMEY